MAYCRTCGQANTGGENYCTKCGAPMGATPDGLPRYGGAESSTPDLVIAGFWTRVLGFIVDSIVLFIVIALPLRGVHVSYGVDAVVTALLNVFYWTLTITYGGRTAGMALAGVRCVRAQDGGVVDLARATRRAVVYSALLLLGSLYQIHAYEHPNALERHQEGVHALAFVVLALPHLLDLLWAAWDPRRQTWHDKAAGTICIVAKRGASR